MNREVVEEFDIEAVTDSGIGCVECDLIRWLAETSNVVLVPAPSLAFCVRGTPTRSAISLTSTAAKPSWLKTAL